MAATQSHFRFYADGTESGAVAHAAEDANPTCGPSGTILLDTIFHLRICLQNDGSVANNVAPQFTYALNGGGYTNITTSSNVVRATASANLTEGANTTQRLSGTGSFETSSSGVTEDGLAGGTAMDLVASGNAETVCSLVVRSADVVHGDVITFRVSGTGISAWTATPTLTVSIPPLDPVTITETLHIDDYGEIQVLGRIRSIDTIVDRTLTTVGGLTREVPAETLHISDAVTPRMTLGPVTLAETLHISDPVTVSLTPLQITAAETLHISDPVTARMTLGTVTVSETLHLSDVVTPVMQAPPILTASLSEEIHAIDGVDSYVALSSIEAVHVVETTLIAELSGATNPSVTRSETLHISDAIAAALLTAGQLSATVAETLHVSDVVAARLNPLHVVLAETLHISDPAVFFGETLFATVSETVFVFDWGFVSMASIEAVHVLDTDLIAELSTPGQLTRSLSETLHLSETPTAFLSPLVVALTETLHIADTIVDRFLTSAGTLDPVLLSEALHIDDYGEIQVLGRIRVLDTDLTVSRQDPGTLTATPFETLHLADAVESWASLDDPEVLHITDTIVDVVLSAAGPLSTGTLTETLHITETAIATMGGLVAAPAETLHLSDVVTASLSVLQAALTETLHVSDQATVTMGDLARVADTEILHMADTVTAEITLGTVAVVETLHITETVTARITLGDVVLAETLHITEAVVGAALAAEGELTTAAAETLHVTDSVTAVLSVLFVTVAPETLHVADTVATGLELAVVRTETLHLTDGPAVPQQVGQPLTVSLTETVLVTDAPTAAVTPLQAVVSETLHVVDDVDIYVAGTLLVTLTETLHIADTVYPERPPVIIGVGIYQFTISGVGIYDPEA